MITHHMTHRIRLALTTAAVGLATATTAPAALLVEESFNIGTGAGEFTAGQPLENQPATGANTNGWSGAWDVTAANLNDVTAESGGLAYSAIPGTTIGGTGGSNGHADAGAQAVRPIGSNATLQAADTLWARVLWQPQSNTNGEFFSFRRDSSGDGRFTIRHREVQAGGLVSDILLRPISGNSGDDVAVFSSPAAGQTHLMLFKIDIDRTGTNDETVSLWVDPIATNEAGLGAPSALVAGDFLNNSDNQFAQFDFTGNTNYLLDEIAIGETFFDVTGVIPGADAPPAVPEPASMLLVGLGGAALLRRRRA